MNSIVLVPLACCIAMGQTYTEANKPRVYISDSNSWQMVGGFSSARGAASGGFAGGASPQTVEVIKTFGQRCPAVVVTMDRTKAEYVVLFDREGGKGAAHRRDKIAVFRNDADVLYSGSTRSLGNAVQDSCVAIQGDIAKSLAPSVAISHDALPTVRPPTPRLEPIPRGRAVAPPVIVPVTVETTSPPAQPAAVSLPAIPQPPVQSSQTIMPELSRSSGLSQVQFAEAIQSLAKKWNQMPEGYRARCAGASTVPGLQQCILTQQQFFLRDNPGARLDSNPWLYALEAPEK